MTDVRLAGSAKRSYYTDTINNFLVSENDAILGALAKNSAFGIETSQRDAWLIQIEILKEALADIQGHVHFEFNVPRIGSRIDVVVLTGPLILPIEFKVGETTFNKAAINQAWDYALDLKNFHKASHSASIIPILVATEASHSPVIELRPHSDKVYFPVCCCKDDLLQLVDRLRKEIQGPSINADDWAGSPYHPTPTIIEAAQALYSQHSVDSISRHDAGARNLQVTSSRIEELVEVARTEKQKVIIFVTGVPGAGKTLVGLNIATKKRDQSKPTHAVFLSGNGPLVKVLTEALTRDEVSRLKQKGERVRKGDVGQKIKAFIQNVHHFRDEGIRESRAPSDHVVIFDEAQRAWNKEMTAQFMARKKDVSGFAQSEPEFLISYLDRHRDWAVVICLVGGGQEINRGEAGISAWLDAVRKSFPNWHVHLSSDLTDSEYAAGHAIDLLKGCPNVNRDNALHLSVSMRSFRAEKVSSFVKAVLDKDAKEAANFFGSVRKRYPIVLTRDINQAKRWIRQQARGNERYGLVASSGAQRLKPHAIDIRVEVDPVQWFLNDSDDTRSSYYLEDAATEFQVQGLELDWVCVTWDADLRYVEGDWSYHNFVGAKWNTVRKPDRKQYLLNAYRVLLTRARQGMVIFVPNGDESDHTRLREFYDPTYQYLSDVGIPNIGMA